MNSNKAEVRHRYRKFNDWDILSGLTPKNLKELFQRLNFIKTQPSMVSWRYYNQNMAACATPIITNRPKRRIGLLPPSLFP
ncbi:hypothetical protein HLH18_13695 [Acinetobacter sp. ANC 5414]|nr:hypothetical protein [Acinetobacter sp. ANC 5414]